MSAPAWTPGPWTVDTDATYPMGSYISNVSGDADICMMSEWNLADEAECRANASLIAAAPDLYRALEELSCMVNGLPVSDLESERRIQAALAALAKAQGAAS